MRYWERVPCLQLEQDCWLGYQELINGRIAMAAITAATGLSISQGTFLNELLDGRLPQSWF